MQRRQVDQATAGTSGAAPARPALVGRRVDLDRLAAALEAAAHGRGRMLFLSGDPGIGKTRLAHEVLAFARTRGCRVLEGRAYPLEAGLAYAPILAAFGPFLRSLDPARQARFVNGLPDLGRLFADLRLPAPEPLADPALEKTRLFEAVARLVERLTRDTPVVLFLDDLHWADPASIELLHYLGRGLTTQPVLVLGTYRTSEVDSTRGLRALLTSLRRAGLAEELALSRLDQAEVAELAGSVLGGEAPVELLALLEARAGGTPLFVEALLQALMDTGQLVVTGGGWTLGPDAGRTLPAGVRELILERLERLGPADRGVMDVIAVHGEAIPSAILQSTTRLSEEALLGALDRLRASGLIAEELDGPEVRYDLSHPLIREVSYGELSEIARRRAHAAIAASFGRVRRGDRERLAFH